MEELSSQKSSDNSPDEDDNEIKGMWLFYGAFRWLFEKLDGDDVLTDLLRELFCSLFRIEGSSVSFSAALKI